MYNKTEVGQVKKFFCTNCNSDRNCKIEGYYYNAYPGDYLEWEEFYILKCQGCDFCFLMKETLTEDDVQYDEVTHEFYAFGIKEYFPPKSKRSIPDWIRKRQSILEKNSEMERVFEVLSEVYGALNGNLLTLALIGIRTTFDVASKFLGIDSSLSFKNKVEKLKQENKLRVKEEERINILVEAGNAAAHRAWKPDFSDINTVMDILEEFIHREIFLPALSEERRRREQDLQKRVPPRPPRTPKNSNVKLSAPEKSPASE